MRRTARAIQRQAGPSGKRRPGCRPRTPKRKNGVRGETEPAFHEARGRSPALAQGPGILCPKAPGRFLSDNPVWEVPESGRALQIYDGQAKPFRAEEERSAMGR